MRASRSITARQRALRVGVMPVSLGHKVHPEDFMESTYAHNGGCKHHPEKFMVYYSWS